MIMSTFKDQNGNSYAVSEIQTITGSKGGGPFSMAGIDTIVCGDKTYSIAKAHTITVMVVGANGVASVYGGTASANKTSAYPGEEITVSHELNTSGGYQLLGVQVYNADTMKLDSQLTSACKDSGTFDMPNYNVLVMFITNAEYDIVVDSDHGTVKVVSKAIEGQNVNVTITPASGYYAKRYSVDNTDESSSDYGTTIDSGTFNNSGVQSFEFTMVAAKVTIFITYEALPTYTNTVLTVNGGTIKVSPTTATAGKTIIVTLTPKSGYKLGSYTRYDSDTNEQLFYNDGYNEFEACTEYFLMPERDVTHTAKFIAVPSYNITYDTSGIGQVTGPDSAPEGSTVEITLTPSQIMNATTDKFKVETTSGTVILDETNLGKGVKTKTFTMPGANVLITTVFDL